MLNVVIRKKNAQCSNDGETQPDGVTGDGWWLVSMFGMQRCCFHDAMQEGRKQCYPGKGYYSFGAGSEDTAPRRTCSIQSKAFMRRSKNL